MNERLKDRLKDLLAVPRGEAQAWVVLIVAIFAMAGWVVYVQFFEQPPSGDLSEERKVLDDWLAQREADKDQGGSRIELFTFDPNHLPIDQWQRLGLTARQAEAIHRFEDRGGSFRSKADLARIRVIKPELLTQWLPYIQLPDSTPGRRASSGGGEARARHRDSIPYERSSGSTPAIARHAIVEVNTCDTAQLIALPGIGPAFARGIVKYRDQLGGFVSLDQLAEVYVLRDKPDAVARLKEMLQIDTAMVRRLSINTCTAEDLAAHPYLRWKLARPLIAFREQHGRFNSREAIKGCSLITDDLYRKIAPYLIVE